MRKKLVTIVAVLVIIIGGIWGGSAIYASKENSKAPTALSLSTPTAATATEGASSGATPGVSDSGSLEGDWSIVQGSQAGYRVAEVLNGQNVTVVGRTESVEGSVTIADSKLTAAQVSVDLTGVATDNGSRDSQFLSILKTAEFPSATFTLSAPVDIAAIKAGVASVKAVGDLTIAGTTKSVTVDLKAQSTGSGVEVQGSIPVTFSDYGIAAPDLGFVKVEPAGSVEMLLKLSK
ncbi:YceI family protein [Arthrobacter psychrolactophilus]|uniref:YceI family protein n=1 Tax=Arthrobacter psychrolactophilus TaxID=92442 RepID=A0A2V5J4G2_9MICC|nr:YceI family protein [Arthrobacter psychrolactophilus]PYI37200.1 YceI family protein [Arthrobacter psychrolactophilus]